MPWTTRDGQAGSTARTRKSGSTISACEEERLAAVLPTPQLGIPAERSTRTQLEGWVRKYTTRATVSAVSGTPTSARSRLPGCGTRHEDFAGLGCETFAATPPICNVFRCARFRCALHLGRMNHWTRGWKPPRCGSGSRWLELYEAMGFASRMRNRGAYRAAAHRHRTGRDQHHDWPFPRARAGHDAEPMAVPLSESTAIPRNSPRYAVGPCPRIPILPTLPASHRSRVETALAADVEASPARRHCRLLADFCPECGRAQCFATASVAEPPRSRAM